MNFWIFLVPFITALIGWIITHFVIKMFFRAGNSTGGTAERRQELAAQLGKLICDDTMSISAIAGKSNSGDLKKLMPTIEPHVDNYLRNKLHKTFPVMRVFIGGKTIDQLKNIFLEQMEQLFPVLMQNHLNNVAQDFDPEKIIVQKLSALPPATVESLLRSALGKKLRYAEWTGALTGFVLGLIGVLSTYFMLR